MNVERLFVFVGMLSCLVGCLQTRGENVASAVPKTNALELADFPADAPARPLQLLFIHHSCGGQWLAAKGPPIGTNEIYLSHPNGGDLRARLERENYRVHEASYGSRIGENTDLFDWLPKFHAEMDPMLSCAFQDTRLSEAENQIVVFKSCFPNNAFVSEGVPPGTPAGPELTLWNARAAYDCLLIEFQKRPDILFVCVTAPPLAPKLSPQPWWHRWLHGGKSQADESVKSAALAREFNHWLAAPDGWLKNYDLTNVVVFDYYDILTGRGLSNFSIYPTGDGYDSHPNHDGNQAATDALIPFLNQAVRRAGLSH